MHGQDMVIYNTDLDIIFTETICCVVKLNTIQCFVVYSRNVGKVQRILNKRKI